MTREKAIRIIKTVFKSKETYKYNDCVTHQALNMAIEALSAEAVSREFYEDVVKANHGLAKEIINLKAQIESAEAEWIPVSERLPEAERKSYWVCTDAGYQHECRWTNANRFFPELTTEWHWNICDIPQHSKVIAWMPLPKPYGGEEE